MQKTIFITGASSGVGKATAKHFQSMGWKVIATMRKPSMEKELIELEGLEIIELDVSDAMQIERTIQQVIERNEVDVVLNNAGYGLIGALEALTDSQISRQLETNLMGIIRISKGFIPHLREKGKGLIINVSSMVGLFGYPTCSVYSSTKFAIDGFSESLAYELASFGVGVKIIAPGGVQTDFAGRSLDGAQHPAYAKLEELVGQGYLPEKVRTFATAEDVAGVIYQAATDGTGQLRYLVGADAIGQYSDRERSGAEAHFQKLKSSFSNI